MPERNILQKRSSGILLHPTCLPGPDGMGDLGPQAFRFVDWLQESGQSIWQVLPLGPTSYGDSPYQTLSALAGNPLLVSLDNLKDAGWLDRNDLLARPNFAADRVDFGAVINWKNKCLDLAWDNFQDRADDTSRLEFSAWRQAQSSWLDNFVLFMALKEDQGGSPWCEWPAKLRDRLPEALEDASLRLKSRLDAHAFRQWLFFSQWHQLKGYAAARGIHFMGDVPIFVAYDSSDVWSRPELFLLDSEGRPTSVAGVPPDYFSKTGQLWGNPLYNWKRLKQEGYQWWLDRISSCLDTVDLVRVDHFRGFAAYWEVPAEEKTAVAGRWVRGPGADFFRALQAKFGDDLPIVAEDLGVITPDVEKLRDDFGLPGMRVLQFAWSGPDNLFQPHNHVPNSVVYAGTHDNDPTVAWWHHSLDQEGQEQVARYLGHEVTEPHWELIRLGMLSCARTFIATMQDVLGLGREGRMNLPGADSGNWNWRMPESAFTDPAGNRLAQLTWMALRRPEQGPPDSHDPSYEPEPLV